SAIDVLDLSNPQNPSKLFEIDITPFGAGINSVAIKNGILAAAIGADPATEPGTIAFFDTDGNPLNSVTVGALPDMVTFTPDGSKVLVANEGEPGDTLDPEGSVSIIDLSAGVGSATVTTADFTAFNGQEEELRSRGVRIFPDKMAAEDFEPEYIAISADSKTAFVTLQENNAIAVVSIEEGRVTEIQPLGFKDWSQSAQLDASNEDGGINLKNYPVLGLYQPDAIATFAANGETYYITANEGDARSEDERVADLVLDPTAFPNAAELQLEENLGRLNVSTVDGDIDGDGDYDKLFTYGGRSFSIWDSTGNQVFDSGDAIARITAELTPELFNANDGDPEEFDQRSDDKGAEPEGVTIGIVNGKTLAFIGLERAGGGVLVYDVSNPVQPEFIQYARFDGDIAPEGLTFISAADSPDGKPLLAVTNEVSGTATIYEIEAPQETFTLQLLHAADQEAGIAALDDAPRFSAVLNALKNQDADGDGNADYANTLVLSSGDAYIPGPFLSASETAFGGTGRGDILIQNELGFSTIAFGNHEFDLGTSLVANLLQPDTETAYPGANFPYLSSNLDFTTDTALAPLVTADGQEASDIPGQIAGNTIVTINGEKIGVVGATTPTLPTISSPGGVGVSPIEFDSTNPADIAALAADIQTSVDALLAANPGMNKVVLLAHMQQISIEQQLAERLTNVDIIVAGGSNTLLADETDRLRAGDSIEGPYPILQTAADGNPIAVVNTDGNYKYVGRLVVDFDANGVIVPDSIDANISGAYATDDAGVAAVGGTPDAEVVNITNELRTVIAAQEGNIFGKTEVFLNGTRGDVRTQETNLGNLTADANLAYAQQIDSDVVISIKNGGGIRDDIGDIIVPPGATGPEDFLKVQPPANELAGKEEGEISQLDITNSLRFNNELTLLTVTASELVEILEHGVSATADGATPGQFPQVAGIAFSFDDDLPPGDRIQSLAIQDAEGETVDVVVENGELVGEGDRTFRLVTLNFLAGGGDGYPFPQRDRIDLVTEDEENPTPDSRTGVATFAADGSEQDALAEYLAATFPAATPFDTEDVSPQFDERIQNLDLRNDTVLDDVVPTPTRVGTDGDDLLVGTKEEDVIDGKGGDDAIWTSRKNDYIDGGDGDDRISGQGGDDTILGGNGDDKLYGEAGNDVINGGDGDDFILAWKGNDTVSGGAGHDIFVFSPSHGTDIIADFVVGEDRIGLKRDLEFSDLSVTTNGVNTEIAVGDETLAILNGVTDSLTAASFVEI
ncbi:MAG: choice-of-anchor I family protein, partial [Geitlerinemataceae cyanobacterium]